MQWRGLSLAAWFRQIRSTLTRWQFCTFRLAESIGMRKYLGHGWLKGYGSSRSVCMENELGKVEKYKADIRHTLGNTLTQDVAELKRKVAVLERDMEQVKRATGLK